MVERPIDEVSFVDRTREKNDFNHSLTFWSTEAQRAENAFDFFSSLWNSLVLYLFLLSARPVRRDNSIADLSAKGPALKRERQQQNKKLSPR